MTFSVFGNHLTGKIPTSVGDWKALAVFDVENNQISGGVLPPLLPFGTMSTCNIFNHLGGSNSYTCPWPQGATESCKKWLAGSRRYVPIADSDCVAAPAKLCSLPKAEEAKCRAAGGCCFEASCDLFGAECSPSAATATSYYQCAAHQCVAAATGVSKAKCEAACGPAKLLRGGGNAVSGALMFAWNFDRRGNAEPLLDLVESRASADGPGSHFSKHHAEDASTAAVQPESGDDDWLASNHV